MPQQLPWRDVYDGEPLCPCGRKLLPAIYWIYPNLGSFRYPARGKRSTSSRRYMHTYSKFCNYNRLWHEWELWPECVAEQAQAEVKEIGR